MQHVQISFPLLQLHSPSSRGVLQNFVACFLSDLVLFSPLCDFLVTLLVFNIAAGGNIDLKGDGV